MTEQQPDPRPNAGERHPMSPGLLALGALAFAAELVLFTAVGLAGWILWKGLIGVIVGAICVITLLVIWALWLAPRTSRRLAFAPRLVVASVLFALPVLLLWGEDGRRWWVLAVGLSWLVYVLTAFPLRRIDGDDQ